jgi:DNA transformation protein
MRSSRAFRDFALDQLSGVPGVTARAMFGGIGLYAGDVFFGIIASDILYLKVDDGNRAEYEAAGSRAFRPFADRAMVMPYYEAPVGVLESADTLAAWARASIRIASARCPVRPTRTRASKVTSKTRKR